ncbi:hypothetical protein [Burkholderia contaminans]|uniref:hypothetical protein n=1 Tax=Burkholderia contaminans TaxID=488447 RepID=UPI001BAD16D8|nr:hypothetical protein [Burkholderia contaminans]QUN49904.1 hypothetical protein KEH59_27015 [Burkholderia contaminans]WFF91924.1 hypothetical protein P4E65_39505 [Burkholderia contaminans]
MSHINVPARLPSISPIAYSCCPPRAKRGVALECTVDQPSNHLEQLNRTKHGHHRQAERSGDARPDRIGGHLQNLRYRRFKRPLIDEDHHDHANHQPRNDHDNLFDPRRYRFGRLPIQIPGHGVTLP